MLAPRPFRDDIVALNWGGRSGGAAHYQEKCAHPPAFHVLSGGHNLILSAEYLRALALRFIAMYSLCTTRAQSLGGGSAF
jgi:hypothetical protein